MKKKLNVKHTSLERKTKTMFQEEVRNPKFSRCSESRFPKHPENSRERGNTTLTEKLKTKHSEKVGKTFQKKHVGKQGLKTEKESDV